jgi:hypothetical protein
LEALTVALIWKKSEREKRRMREKGSDLRKKERGGERKRERKGETKIDRQNQMAYTYSFHFLPEYTVCADCL